ncbi:Hypothetical_protein [Hexamita inflata]|uniref:Hypothetical_protein n=1 Tax=Hexamita inflata TaxID=28002 RepID=A0AA86P4Y5_9EUKA|nr:Hypothetical protein HINF_LOCUS18144 [Hexamita inflata]
MNPSSITLNKAGIPAMSALTLDAELNRSLSIIIFEFEMVVIQNIQYKHSFVKFGRTFQFVHQQQHSPGTLWVYRSKYQSLCSHKINKNKFRRKMKQKSCA